MWTRDRLFRRFISRIITIHHNTHFTLPSTEPAHSSCCFPFQRLTRGGKTVNKLFLFTKIAHFPCEAFTMLTFDAEYSYQWVLSSFAIHARHIKFVGFIHLTFGSIHFPFHDNRCCRSIRLIRATAWAECPCMDVYLHSSPAASGTVCASGATTLFVCRRGKKKKGSSLRVILIQRLQYETKYKIVVFFVLAHCLADTTHNNLSDTFIAWIRIYLLFSIRAEKIV